MSKYIILVKFIPLLITCDVDRYAVTAKHHNLHQKRPDTETKNDSFYSTSRRCSAKVFKKNIYIYTYVKWLTWWTFFCKTRYILIKAFASHIREALQLILIHTTKRKCFLDKSILKNSVSIRAQVFTAAEPADAIRSENNLI